MLGLVLILLFYLRVIGFGVLDFVWGIVVLLFWLVSVDLDVLLCCLFILVCFERFGRFWLAVLCLWFWWLFVVCVLFGLWDF